MMSEIPRTAPARTSSALAKAASRLASLPRMVSSFSLGMVISESTHSDRERIPSSATCMRLRPSKGKGRVTTATVRIPISLATSAMIGAAPVPVPPPMPVVMKTMSAPSRTSAMRSRSSMAAWRPISGLVPAPRPLVTPGPSCSTVRDVTFFRAWASVFAQMNSTPSTPLLTMWLTALPPPPPTPMTLITALCGMLSTSSNMVPSLSFRIFAYCRGLIVNYKLPWTQRFMRSRTVDLVSLLYPPETTGRGSVCFCRP